MNRDASRVAAKRAARVEQMTRRLLRVGRAADQALGRACARLGAVAGPGDDRARRALLGALAARDQVAARPG